jgi:hypothetical protein
LTEESSQPDGPADPSPPQGEPLDTEEAIKKRIADAKGEESAPGGEPDAAPEGEDYTDQEGDEYSDSAPPRPADAPDDDIEEVEPADLAKTNILIMFGAFVLAMVSLAFAPSAGSGMRREADVNFSFYVFGFLGTIGGLLAIFYLPSVIRARKELSPTWNFLGFVGGLGLIVYLVVIIIGVIVSIS